MRANMSRNGEVVLKVIEGLRLVSSSMRFEPLLAHDMICSYAWLMGSYNT